MELPGRKIEEEKNELMVRIGKVFANESRFRRAKKYIEGLLSPIARKNGWQMAEALGGKMPYSLQQFLYRGRFGVDGLRDELRDYTPSPINLRKSIDKRVKMG